MLTKAKFLEALGIINAMFPEAHGELKYETPFQLLIATLFSAQATDIGVNKMTPALFAAFPKPVDFAKASQTALEKYTHTIGLYHQKTKNSIKTAQMLVDWGFGDGNSLPKDKEKLQELPGVGIKTANVVLGEIYGIPGIAVDTHVARVSKRLGLVKETADVGEIEKKLMRTIPKQDWISSHHHLIFFGRYHCTAKTPKCDSCPVRDYCSWVKTHG